MSSLTGETKPVVMRVVAEDLVVVVHSHNIGFSSSLVINGEAVGVVIRYVRASYALAPSFDGASPSLSIPPSLSFSLTLTLPCSPFLSSFPFLSLSLHTRAYTTPLINFACR